MDTTKIKVVKTDFEQISNDILSSLSEALQKYDPDLVKAIQIEIKLDTTQLVSSDRPQNIQDETSLRPVESQVFLLRSGTWCIPCPRPGYFPNGCYC